jgi:hypothetical protein
MEKMNIHHIPTGMILYKDKTILPVTLRFHKISSMDKIKFPQKFLFIPILTSLTTLISKFSKMLRQKKH